MQKVRGNTEILRSKTDKCKLNSRNQEAPGNPGEYQVQENAWVYLEEEYNSKKRPDWLAVFAYQGSLALHVYPFKWGSHFHFICN